MLIAIRVFYTIALGLFAAGTVIYLRAFSQRVPGPRRPRALVVSYGVLFQLIGLAMYTIYLHQAPFLGMFQGLVFASFVLGLLFLMTARVLEDERSVGIIILPLICLFQLSGIFTPLEYVDDPSLSPNPWFILHASVALFSYGAFCISFAAAVLYLLLHRQIKGKHLGRIFERLPSLGELDYLTYRSVSIGFIGLTLSIAFGMVWTQLHLGKLLQGDSKEIITLVNWMVYALYLHSRFYRGWQGKRSAVLAILGFVVLIFNFVFVTVLLSRTHAYL
ncbi:MAG: cytochrome c biogenesis protein CcsA [Candidatus Glassbacteria bacterium]|nr:cytochrome c biogenesis protein CcsA [Candidatus Glassbacteria bacterium]